MKRCIIAVAVIVSLVALVKPARAQPPPEPGTVPILEEVKPKPPPCPPLPPCPEKDPGRQMRNAGIAVTILGGVALLTGITLLSVALNADMDRDSGPYGGVLVGATSGLATAALLFAGIPLWAVGQDKMNAARKSYTLAPVVSPNRAGLAFGFNF